MDESMAVLPPIRQKIESRLYHFGFSSAVVRHLLCTQIMISGAALIAGLVFLPLTAWPLSFASGACIAAYSLWGVARFAQANVNQRFSALMGLKLFFSFTGRFLLIGAMLFALIVLLKTPIIPLVIGLTSMVAGIAAWGIFRFFRKTAKEA